MTASIDLRLFIAAAGDGMFSALARMAPWDITSKSEAIIRNALGSLNHYQVFDGVAVHRTATVEHAAVVKAPAIIGANSFVAAGAYLRGGVFLDENCIIGPSCEVKSTYMLSGSKIAHLSFVGDSIIGAGANIEAGAIIANYRNERDDKRIRIAFEGEVLDTGVEKFGALVGDRVKIGAGAVIAPGALFRPDTIVLRGALIDQSS